MKATITLIIRKMPKSLIDITLPIHHSYRRTLVRIFDDDITFLFNSAYSDTFLLGKICADIFVGDLATTFNYPMSNSRNVRIQCSIAIRIGGERGFRAKNTMVAFYTVKDRRPFIRIVTLRR